ncbi:MAG: metallophosphoesterase [Methylococcales bacterium]|nr:metallophosphoesterase [Methylococcales bacterium]
MSTNVGDPLVQFQVISDLHLEMLPKDTLFDEKLPPAHAPLLIMAGDIYVGRENNFGNVISEISRRYKQIIYVPGNHEYYGFRTHVYAMNEVQRYMREVCDAIPNVHFLDNNSTTINGVNFMGATMWTNIPESEFPLTTFKMADFSVIGMQSSNTINGIRELSPEDIVSMHKMSKQYFEQQIHMAMKNPKQPQILVAITHHAPSSLYVGNWFRGDEYKPFYFSTDLNDLMHRPPVSVWVHGHTHCSNDVVTSGGTRLVSNARGYDAPDFKELNPLYDPNKVVSVYSDGSVSVRSL